MDIQKQIQELSDRLKRLEHGQYMPAAPANYTPTEVGWAAGVTFDCNYVKVGKLVHLWYQINGTSDVAGNHTITLPGGGTIAHDTALVETFHYALEGAVAMTGVTLCNDGATVLDFNKDTAATNYAGTGVLNIAGYVCYWEL